MAGLMPPGGMPMPAGPPMDPGMAGLGAPMGPTSSPFASNPSPGPVEKSPSRWPDKHGHAKKKAHGHAKHKGGKK